VGFDLGDVVVVVGELEVELNDEAES